ncbi:MAG: tetratricopeptide repeat protein [Bacteroidota bacterium]
MSAAQDHFDEAESFEFNGEFAKAVKHYQKAIEEDPNLVHAYNGWGNVLLKLNKLEEARQKYEKCLELDSNYHWASFNLGKSYEGEDLSRAAYYYEKATKQEPRYADAFNEWGNCLFNLGRKVEAAGKYEKCLELAPTNKWARYNLTRIYQADEPEKALEHIEKTVAVDEAFVDAYNLWGNILLDQGKLEEARKKYEKCVEIDPDYSHAYYNIGLTHENKDHLEKAVEFYKLATERDDMFLEAFNKWGKILQEQGKDIEAREKFERCLVINPSYTLGMYYLCETYEKVDPEKAIDYLQRAIEIDPKYVNAYNKWGNILVDQGKKEESREKYEKCLSLDSNYQWAHCNLGHSYERENPSKAIQYFSRATEIDPNYVTAFSSWANVLVDLNKTEEARKLYEKCLSIDEDYDHALIGLGRSFELEAPLKSISYYERALKKDDKLLDAYLGWGNALFALERNKEAREKYSKCLEVDSNFRWALLNIGITYQTEDPLKAIESYRNCLAQDSTVYEAYNGIYHCITLFDEPETYIEEFESLVQDLNTGPGYLALGNLYQYYLLDYENSLIYYQKCIELGYEEGVSLELSNLYDSVGNLEQSVETLELRSISEKVEGKIYPYHNKAHYLLKMGKYEKSRALWKEVLSKYEEAFENDFMFKANSDNYVYYGSIHFEIFGEITEAQKAYQVGMKVQQGKQNLKLLVSQNKLLAEIDKISLDSKISTFWQRNSNLKQAEKVFRNMAYKFEEDYYQLAEIYITEELFEEAHGIVEEYFKLNRPKSSRWYNLKGQLFLAKEEYGKAINAFKKAIKLEGHSFSLRNNLANAHLRNKSYADAEVVFDKVLKRDPNNVDALIGMGEIYLTRSSDDDPDELLLEKAEKYFLKALQKGRSPQGSKQLNQYEPKVNQKRKYKDLKLSDLYYSLGYIKYKQYQKSEIQDRNKFIKESLKFFGKAQEVNPENLKAKKAKEKIDNSILSFQKSSRTENLGAILVTGLSLIVFLLGQYFFYFHSPRENEVSLTQQNVTQLSGILTLDSVEMANITKLVSVPFEEKSALLKAVEGSVAKAKTAGKMETLNALSLGKQESVKGQPLLPPGYYALISFGAIMFMIAGFYLPKLLKLKVGVIEIEKNSLSEAHDFSLLGIQK